MRVESKLEDMYINDLIKVHKYLKARKNDLITCVGIKTGQEVLHKEYEDEIDYLEKKIFSEYKMLSKNSKSYSSDEPQTYFIP